MLTNHKREITTLRIFTFAVFMTSGVIISYLPLYFKSLGFTSVQIGFLYSLGPLISIVSNFVWGVTSDKLQTIKKVLQLLLISQIITSFVLGLASTYGAVIVLLAAFNFFYYPMSPLTDSLAIVTTTAHKRSFVSVRVFGSIGFAFSALMFGFILGHIGAAYTIYVIIALGTFNLILGLFITDKQASIRKMEFGGLLQILAKREIIAFFFCVLLLAIAHRINEAFLGLSLVELGGAESIVGWAWTISAVSEIPIFFLLNAYGERFKELPLLAIAAGMYVVRLLIASLVQTPFWLMSTQAMHGITFGIYYFVAIRYLNRIIPEEYRATGMAVYTIVWSSIAGLLSGTIGGPLMESYGKDVVYMAGVCFAALAGIGFILISFFSMRGGSLASVRKSSHK